MRTETAPVEAPITVPVDTSTGDHERYAHYVYGDDPGAIISRAVVLGVPVKGLCGKVWIPSRSPDRFPVCPECAEIREAALSRNEN